MRFFPTAFLIVLLLVACSEGSPPTATGPAPTPSSTPEATSAPFPPTAAAPDPDYIRPLATIAPTMAPVPIAPERGPIRIMRPPTSLATREASRPTSQPTLVPTRAYSPPELIVVPTFVPTRPYPTPPPMSPVTPPTRRPYPTLPPPVPVPPPPFPTLAVPTLPPLPTFEPPSPPRGEKVPIPEFVPATAAEVEFAAACGELMDADMGLAEWVQALQDLEAPPELRDFWEATVGQYSSLMLPDGTLASNYNSMTQAAFDREIEIVAGMRPVLRQALIDGWCLLETDVLVGGQILAARARLAAGLLPPLSYEDYAQGCADISLAAPTFDTADALLTHLIEWWQVLIPPAGVEDYHAAVLAVYVEWRAVGDIELVEAHYLRAPLQEATKVDGNFVEHLLRSGCIE